MFELCVHTSFQLSKNPVECLRQFVSCDRFVKPGLKLSGLLRQPRHSHMDGIDSGLKRFHAGGIPGDIPKYAQSPEQSVRGANDDQRRPSRGCDGF